MHVYHLTELREIFPPAVTPLFYGRYLSEVRSDGTLYCDDRQFAIDGAPPAAGTRMMIWRNRDYFCCPADEFEPNAGEARRAGRL